MDPNTATRLEFTNHVINKPIDDDASPKWARLVENHKTLLDALAHHDAMKPNLYQTYMTPAANKNKVYFEWDFVGRTLHHPNPAKLSRKGREDWQDAIGRATLAKCMITDANPGMLEMMTESTYPEQRGRHPAFGEAVLEAARKLDDYNGE